MDRFDCLGFHPMYNAAPIDCNATPIDAKSLCLLEVFKCRRVFLPLVFHG